MKRIALALVPAALGLAAARAAADEIVLRNGRTLEGEVVESGETITFKRPGVSMEIRRDEVQEIRARNHARQIPGTHYWAVMTIDDPTKARFVRRLLEFVGCHDETVRAALRGLGLPQREPVFRLLSA